MAVNAVTYTSAGTAAAEYAMPTSKEVWFMIKSHKANTGLIWMRQDGNSTVAAVAEADENVLIEPGESILMRRFGDSINIITPTSGTKFSLMNAMGRVV
jgi:hypothetical protein